MSREWPGRLNGIILFEELHQGMVDLQNVGFGKVVRHRSMKRAYRADRPRGVNFASALNGDASAVAAAASL